MSLPALMSNVLLSQARAGDPAGNADTKSSSQHMALFSQAISVVEKRIKEAKAAREGKAGFGHANIMPCFDRQQFEKWMRATMEGTEQPRGNNDDSDTELDSDDSDT